MTRLVRPVTNIVAIGMSDPHRVDLSRRPWMPDGTAESEFPGKVKAKIADRAVCIPK